MLFRKIKNIYHFFQSLLANIYYGFPAKKLIIIGVTGTSGKTTTALMLYEILKKAGFKVSVLTTVKAIIGGKEYDTGFHVTTPDPQQLPKYLKQAVENGDTHFVLEVSSHALDQNRAAFVPFKIGILTSFAHEHLDYHKTLVNYAKAKFKLLHKADHVVLGENVINDSLKKSVKYSKLKNKLTTFGYDSGNVNQKDWKIRLNIGGNYNILDALACVAAASILGINKLTIKKALEDFRGVEGRFEKIPNKKGLTLIIDFAHKPDALEAVLKDASLMIGKGGRIIVMYGCASERDLMKRPIMGEISAQLADITVITDEDPRREDRMKIINEIAQGCIEGGATGIDSLEKPDQNINKHIFYKIPDRSEAIDFIINKLAKKGDVVLFCGKGHEKSMNYNGKELPWSEHEAVNVALNK